MKSNRTQFILVIFGLAAFTLVGCKGWDGTKANSNTLNTPLVTTKSIHSTVQSTSSVITLPNGSTLTFIAEVKQQRWEVRNQNNLIIVYGPLFSTFKGDKIYQSELNLDVWAANQSWVVMQLDETIHGFNQPVELKLFAFPSDMKNVLLKPVVVGHNSGGMHFFWEFQNNSLHVIQKTLDKTGRDTIEFDKKILLNSKTPEGD